MRSGGATDGLQAFYSAGDHIGVARGGLWLLADLPPGSPLITAIWSLPESDLRLASVLDSLMSSGIGALPDFGLVSQEQGEIVIVLRGKVEARVGGVSDGGVAFDGTGVTTWLERRLPSGTGPIELTLGTDDGEDRFPLGDGVVRARRLLITSSDRAGSVSLAPGPLVDRTGADPTPGRVGTAVPPAPPDPEASKGVAAEVEFSPGPPDEEPATETGQPPESFDTRVFETSGADELASDVPEPDEEGSPDFDSGSSPDGPAGLGELGYDFLFGHTLDRTVEEAAVRELDEPPPVAGPSPASPAIPPANDPGAVSGPPPLIPGPPSSPRRRVTAPRSGIIDSVPLVGGSSRPPDPVPPGPPVTPTPRVAVSLSGGPQAAGDDDGMTVNKEALERLRRAGPGGPSTGGPSVHAVYCGNGHANPAHASVCRVCGDPLSEQSPVTVPRPVLGVLRLSTGDVVTLDRSVLMGRKPSPDRLIDGEKPHLVKMASSTNEISRNHLEVRLQGWHVLVSDLGSMNGTLVILPGREPERLRPDIPTAIEPGTTVKLADEVSFTFEVES